MAFAAVMAFAAPLALALSPPPALAPGTQGAYGLGHVSVVEQVLSGGRVIASSEWRVNADPPGVAFCTLTATVTDSDGATGTATQQIPCLNNENVTLDVSDANATVGYQPGDSEHVTLTLVTIDLSNLLIGTSTWTGQVTAS